MEILMLFVNFWLNRIQRFKIVPSRSRKWKKRYLAFNWKKNYFCQMFTDDARLMLGLDLNVTLPLDLTRNIESYHKRSNRRKFPENQEQPIPCEINHAPWLVKNGKTLFSKLTQKISWLTQGKEARSRWASKWISPLRQILFILLGSYFNDVCCTFHLGQMLIRFLSINFDIYCSLALQLSCTFSDKNIVSKQNSIKK